MTEREERLAVLLTRFLPFCEGCGGSGYRYCYAYAGIKQPCPVCFEARELLGMEPPARTPAASGAER